MKTKFKRQDLPIAYAMISAAERVRPRRDGRHPYEIYFYYWTAFHQVYTTLANRAGCSTQLIINKDGSISTHPNGNVQIPDVNPISEREQTYHALNEFDSDRKHALITHESTKYFVQRIPFWQGKQIEFDAFGQKLNGVIHIEYTMNDQYPVWSPIDRQVFAEYLAIPGNKHNRQFLAKQILDLLFTVKNNLAYASKKFDDANDLNVIMNALPLLKMIMDALYD